VTLRHLVFEGRHIRAIGTKVQWCSAANCESVAARSPTRTAFKGCRNCESQPIMTHALYQVHRFEDLAIG